MGSLKSRPWHPGRALPKPARCGTPNAKVSDQTAIETVFPKGSTISAAYIKYLSFKIFQFWVFFFLTWCIEDSTFLCFLKLQTKLSHPRPPQGHTEMISDCIYVPANSKYFPKNTEGPEPVSQKRLVPEIREGSWGLPGQGGEVEASASSFWQDTQL